MTEDEVKCGRDIVSAFSFLSEIGHQVESLRNSIKGQLSGQQSASVTDFAAEDSMDIADWVCRTVIDTFIIRRKPRKGALAIYGSVQISLAPRQVRADGKFSPHVAVLLASSIKGWEQWECEEFQLNEDLDALDAYDDPWVPDGESRWIPKSGAPAVAFWVPLVLLRNEGDVASHIVEPMLLEAEKLFERTGAIA